MQSPYHWQTRTILSWLLLPLSWLYWAIAAWRASRIKPVRLTVPVICVGNNGVGGAGKTPTAILLANILSNAGYHPHIISRGYKGKHIGTIRVDSTIHIAEEVGDEPLLLAHHAPCWVSRRRINAARAAIAEGADVILMDDGLQNPTLYKDLTLLVIDGDYGFGSGFMIPAGPGREPISSSMAKADAVLIIGNETNPDIRKYIPSGKPLFNGLLQPAATLNLQGMSVHPFAGIGHPDKFFRTMERMGAQVTSTSRFDDHHAYTQQDLDRLQQEASEHSAQLVTTEKDYVRLPEEFRSKVIPVPVRLVIEPQEAFNHFILEHIMSKTGS